MTIPIDGTNQDNFGSLAEAVAAYLDQFPKTCHCCARVYHLTKPETLDGLRPSQLDFDGNAYLWTDLEGGDVANGLEYRQCPCGSTLNACVEIFFPNDRPTFGEPAHLNQIVGGVACAWCREPSTYKYCSPRCTRDALGMTPADEFSDEDESEAA